MAEKKKALYDRGEILFPKGSNLKARTVDVAKFIGVSFNEYVISAVETKLKEDEAIKSRCREQFVVCKDELEIQSKSTYKSGYVFSNREDTETETVVRAFDSLEEAMEFVNREHLTTEIEPITKRFNIVTEYAISREFVDCETGLPVKNFGYVWYSSK